MKAQQLYAGFLAALVVLQGCSKIGTAEVQHGVLRIAVVTSPTQLNPILILNTTENFIDGLMFSELVTVDAKGREIPDLAAVVPTLQNGGISRNGLTITYHLRRNVRWQDGVPFTSRDVQFTWQAVMNPGNNVLSRRGYDRVASVDTPDPFTIVFHMKGLFAPAIDTLFGESDMPYRILPAHLLVRYPNINEVDFNSAPVGTGPFRFVRWIRNDELVLDANPSYFRGAPKLKRIIIKIIPDDNTIGLQLHTHEVDLGFEIGRTTYHDLERFPDVQRLLVPAPAFAALIFNLDHPPFDDVRVRRAFALALNRASLTQKLTYGTAELAAADLSSFSWGFNPNLKPLPYDPKEALRILAQAGWHLQRNGSGKNVLEKNGRPLTVQMPYSNGLGGAGQILLAVQEMLAQIGVQVELKGFSPQILDAPAASGGIFYGGHFDFSSYGWIAGYDPDNSSLWICSMKPPNGNNLPRYCSPEMDASQRLALSTFDRTVRKHAYATIEALLVRDVPAIFLYHPEQRYAFTPALHGFNPNGISESWNANEWRI